MESSKLATILDCFLKLSDTENVIPSSQVLDRETQGDVIEMLIQIVEKMAGDFLKKKISITNPMMCHVEKECFYHGAFVSDEIAMPITLFYFSDLKKGLFAIAGVGKNTEIFRFSLKVPEEKIVVH